MDTGNAAEKVKIFLLGVIATLLAVIAFRPSGAEYSHAADGAMGASAGGIIALTGPEKSTLYLVDTNNKQVAQYAVDSARFSLRAARHYSQDLKIYDENKKGGIRVKEADSLAKKSSKAKK